MVLAVILIIILFGMLYFIICNCNCNYDKEQMTVVGSGEQKNSVAKPFTGTFTTFNGRMAIDDQYFYDKIFDNVTYYDNDYDYDTGDLIKTGWEKCTTGCSGNCVEYFVSGRAYCFPY
jgi:hypothetical protein